MRSRGTTLARPGGHDGGMAHARLVLVLTITAAVAAGSAGCGGAGSEPPPTPDAPVSLSPSAPVEPSPSPSPVDPAAVPPERPAAMDTVDSAGAEAFAAYFVQLFAYAFATNDLQAWTDASHPDCIYCTNVAEAVRAQVASGSHSVGGTDIVNDMTALEVEQGHWWAVQMTLVQAPSHTEATDGTVSETFPDTVTYRVDLSVVREGDRWLVREATFNETDRVAG